MDDNKERGGQTWNEAKIGNDDDYKIKHLL